MRKAVWMILIAIVLLRWPLKGYAAETAKFRHLMSVYFDDKGGGLKLPEGVACNNRSEFLVADTGNDRLLRFSLAEKAVKGGQEIKVPQLTAPVRVQMSSKGEIYALDGKQRRIVHLSVEGEFKDFVAFDGAPPPATIVPKSFKIDNAGNLYVLDVFSARVLVLNPEGKFQKALNFPQDVGAISEIAIDFAGNVLLLDSRKRRVYSAGKEGNSFAPLGGDLTESMGTMPSYMTAIKGVIFIVEGRGSAVLSLGQDGSFLAKQLTMGWNEGQLNYPSQMCVNEKDEVFIADRDNSRVQIFSLIR
jgi:hypothetical protein